MKQRAELNPLISIVIPVYNVEKYLNDCMNSVLNQTYQNIEIILVDDGATDNSGQLCEKYKEQDSRVQVIHKENGGLSDARNYGIDAVQGDYIMFIDSDDQVDLRMVEILVDTLLCADADIAICDPLHVFKPEDIVYTVSKEQKVYTREEAICEMWYQKSFLPSAWGKLYKTSLFKENKFRVGILYEDIDVMHKLFWDSERIVYNYSKLYAYQHREGSITTKKFSKRDCEILNICQRLDDFAADKSDKLQQAAKAYGVVGALRVELNAPDEPEFDSERDRARKYLKQNMHSVLKNKEIRRKTRIGLRLYIVCRPLMRVVYKRVNRWK